MNRRCASVQPFCLIRHGVHGFDALLVATHVLILFLHPAFVGELSVSCQGVLTSALSSRCHAVWQSVAPVPVH